MGRSEEHSLQVLGYRQLLEEIAAYSQSEGGRNCVLSLRPLFDLAAIKAQRGLYEDLMHLAETARGLPPLACESIAQLLAVVQPQDSVLDGTELRLCLAQLQLVREILAFLDIPEALSLPVLQERIRHLSPCDSLRNSLLRSIDADGSVLDSASERLRELRRSRAAAERHLQKTLDDLTHDSAVEGVLQDRFVTRRNGRYVVPVRRDAVGKLPGLVHDISSSGQTLFVEPTATLAIGNELSTLSAEEREEVRRILAQLSDGVRENTTALQQNAEILEGLDAAAAVARWAGEYSCVLPAFGGFLQLSHARHPLLLSQFRREAQNRKVVPLDLELPAGTKTLAITGSNTGGKTVTLKTVGLLALAAQSGLPVPAGPESLFTLFRTILADIGDEQSLSENLSTFSGHLTNIGDILREAADGDGKALVLLDELGSGTDPAEGGAIACAVLKELAAHDTLTLTTTHLGSVKNFVHATPGMVNGAVRFNLESLRPEYVLELGHPGASHALAIARRLGIPTNVLKSAEGFLSGNELRLEELLSRLEKERRELAEKNAALEENTHAAARDRETVKKQLSELKTTRRKAMNDALKEAEALVANTRRQLENLLREIREAGKSSRVDAPSGAVDALVAKARKTIAQKEQELAQGLQRTADRPAGKPLSFQQATVGKRVWIERLAAHGKITRIDTRRKELEVSVDGMPFQMKLAEIFPEQEPETPKKTTVTIRAPHFEGQTAHEIVLIGLHVEDALDRLTQYLNDCVLAHLAEVRIVHGFGTGKLREGIHQFLKQQPYVWDFRLGNTPQDSGTTFVRLKSTANSR